MDQFALFLQTAVQMGTPMLFATVGGIMCEKVGSQNLGIEGMMLLGAVMGFKIGYNTGNPLLAIIASALAGGFGALIYAIVTITLHGNQIVTGLTLTIFGVGLANVIGGQNFIDEAGRTVSLSMVALPESVVMPLRSINIPFLTNIPIIGKMIFNQSIYAHFALVIAIISYLYIAKTRFGLNMRAVGENPAAADASGIRVSLYKYIHVIAGGMLCGLGGGYLSLVFVPKWTDDMTAGIGWIAVALVIFSTWNPLNAIFGAYFFGALRGIGFKLQGVSIPIFGAKISFPSQLLDMVPYVVTILMLMFISLRKRKENSAPAALGASYYREDR